MHPTVKELISDYRAQIKAHREQTKRIRQSIRAIKETPMFRRDHVGKFRAICALNERLRLIRDCQAQIDRLRAESTP